jgi:hypothetical protein
MMSSAARRPLIGVVAIGMSIATTSTAADASFRAAPSNCAGSGRPPLILALQSTASSRAMATKAA